MPRPAIFLIFLLLIIGALVFLSTTVREVPRSTIETDVNPVANAS